MMGLMAPSLKDMDNWEVNRRRKPANLNANGNRRPANVIMWTVDGSAVVAHPQRSARSECCTIALWRRMMCASSVGRIKGGPHGHSRIGAADDDDDDSEDLDFNRVDESQQISSHKARMWEDVGPKLQTAFGMRRWPQGWI